MLCCEGPLIALAGGSAGIAALMGIITLNPMMFVGGLIGLVGIVGGYFYYNRNIKTIEHENNKTIEHESTRFKTHKKT